MDSSGDQSICCQLSVCSVDDEPSYTALSYVWGNPDITLPIFVNDIEVQITTNLFDALTQLRENNVGTLWVDAVCIDQKNDEEKGHQVQMMRSIYQNADEVIAWLGKEDHNSKKGDRGDERTSQGTRIGRRMEHIQTLSPQCHKKTGERADGQDL